MAEVCRSNSSSILSSSEWEGSEQAESVPATEGHVAAFAPRTEPGDLPLRLRRLQAEAVADELTGAIEAEVARLQEVREVRLASINAAANALEIPAVRADTKEEDIDAADEED